MSIRIEPLENGRLKLSGDVEDEIYLSARALDQGFAIAISDGTLVHARFENWADECRFSIVVEGAGIATISRAERGDVLDLAKTIDWISVAIARDIRLAKGANTSPLQRELSFTDAGKADI
jgi:hypothetical protein